MQLACPHALQHLDAAGGDLAGREAIHPMQHRNDQAVGQRHRQADVDLRTHPVHARMPAEGSGDGFDDEVGERHLSALPASLGDQGRGIDLARQEEVRRHPPAVGHVLGHRPPQRGLGCFRGPAAGGGVQHVLLEDRSPRPAAMDL